MKCYWKCPSQTSFHSILKKAGHNSYVLGPPNWLKVTRARPGSTVSWKKLAIIHVLGTPKPDTNWTDLRRTSVNRTHKPTRTLDPGTPRSGRIPLKLKMNFNAFKPDLTTFDLNYHALSQNNGQKNSVLPCFEPKKGRKMAETRKKHEKTARTMEKSPWVALRFTDFGQKCRNWGNLDIESDKIQLWKSNSSRFVPRRVRVPQEGVRQNPRFQNFWLAILKLVTKCFKTAFFNRSIPLRYSTSLVVYSAVSLCISK